MAMGRQSIYNAFGDKRELFLKALERYAHNTKERLADSLLAPGAGLEAIHRYFEGMLDFVAGEGPRRGCFVANAILELGESDSGVTQQCQTNQAHVTRGLERALGNAIADGDLPGTLDVQATAQMLMSQTYGLGVMSKNGATRQELASGVRELLNRLA